MVNSPSIKTLTERLGIAKDGAKIVKHFMVNGKADKALDQANRELDAHGVEAIWGEGIFPALLYVNRGDTYDTTLCYDSAEGRFFVGSWGGWVEQHPDVN